MPDPGTRTNPFRKDPDDTKTFGVNWSDRLLTGDTLDTSTWTVASGTVAIDTDTSNTTVALVTLAGGAEGERASLRNRVVTAQGEVYDQTIYVRVRTQ